MRQLWRLSVGDQRGGIFLSGLVLVVIMTLLGIALFDLSRIEGALAIGDARSSQALYCAEAALGRTIVDKGAGGRVDQIQVTVSTTPGSTLTWNETVTTVSGACTNVITFTHTQNTTDPTDDAFIRRLRVDSTWRVNSTDPNGTQRSIRIRLNFLAAPFEYAAVGINGDFYVGGDGSNTGPCGSGVPESGPGGDDCIRGDVFVGGNQANAGTGRVLIGTPNSAFSCTGEAGCTGTVDDVNPQIVPRSTSDVRPTVSLPTGATWGQGKAGHSGMWPSGEVDPYGTRPDMPQPNVPQYVTSVQNASGTLSGGVYTPGSFQGSPVYDLARMFAAFNAAYGVPSNGSLPVPTGCSTESRPLGATGDCKLYWDMRPLGLKKNPPDRVSESSGTPGDDYYFDGVYKGEIVSGSDSCSTCQNKSGQRGATSLVDLEIPGQGPPIFLAGADPATGVGSNVRFSWIDRIVNVTYGFAINGRGTIVATNDVMISDNLIYQNVDPTLASPNNRNPVANTTSTADMLGLVAQRDIWYGDPRYGTFVEGSGIMLAGRDFNFVFFDNGNNPTTPRNSMTLNGTMVANRQIAVFRDFANPNDPDFRCPGKSTQCQPIRFDPSDTSCGSGSGCWRFINRDANGNITYDDMKASFKECRGTGTCGSGTTAGARRVTHFQATLTYDNRLFTNTALVPPALPSGGGVLFANTWRDWQECPLGAPSGPCSNN